ncbi:MAG: CHAT domain-containing protein, partial [Armatimonadetes bacterium]|nr:CHAT domain-containing protein [Armatimonadota bacterium]
YYEALELWQKTGDNWMLAWTWKNIGDAFRKLGDEGTGVGEQGMRGKEQVWLKAVDAYWRSVRLMEQVRERVGGEVMSAQFAQNASEPFYQLADLLAQMGRIEEAFEISERMRARALLELMNLATPLEKETVPTGAERVYDELKRRIAELEVKLLKAMASPSPNREVVEQLQKELTEVRNEFERQRDMLRLQKWQLLPVNRGQISFSAWRQLKLPEDTAALIYLIAEQRTLLFVLTNRKGSWQIQSFTLPVTRKRLEEDISWLRERIERRRPVGATLQRLYADLVEPAEKALSGKRKIVIVPDGPLYALPFQILQDDNEVYLVERFAIAYAPSLTTLLAIQKRENSVRVDETRSRKKFGQVSPAPTNERLSSNPTTRNLPKWQWTGLAVTSFGVALEPLPYAREEVRWISGFLNQAKPKLTVRTFVDAAATKQSALQALKESRWVHFATHAILEPKRPLYSRLIFAAGKGQDSMLRAFEVLDLGQTPSEMVVLSACETGLGKVLKGEGLMGLVWTFMAAGTKTLVVSQWRVNDLSTAKLMRAYYRHLLNGLKPAEAMRRAQMSLFSQRQFHHPYHWAGFVVWGEGF